MQKKILERQTSWSSCRFGYLSATQLEDEQFFAGISPQQNRSSTERSLFNLLILWNMAKNGDYTYEDIYTDSQRSENSRYRSFFYKLFAALGFTCVASGGIWHCMKNNKIDYCWSIGIGCAVLGGMYTGLNSYNSYKEYKRRKKKTATHKRNYDNNKRALTSIEQYIRSRVSV